MARKSFKSFYGTQVEIRDLKESVRRAEEDWNDYVRDLPDGSDCLDMYMNGPQQLEAAKEFHYSLLKTFDEFALLRKIPVSDIEEAYHVITKNDHWKTVKKYVDWKHQTDPNSDRPLEHHTYLRAVYLGLASQDKIEEVIRDIEGAISSIDDVTPCQSRSSYAGEQKNKQSLGR
ncbi:hypothetical protein SeMB42_g07686 [Synchytrium endobioticum]|uniref:Uncharacterized protein n=1 Tax=Synchytrium endobioticum TaxID=286115 RepID=A0A507C2X9_9FUNG|nr:hypothetical protein SeMB42_g07686 [Synchytrium endobioticum]